MPHEKLRKAPVITSFLESPDALIVRQSWRSTVHNVFGSPIP
jgi:hypothetical protein